MEPTREEQIQRTKEEIIQILEERSPALAVLLSQRWHDEESILFLLNLIRSVQGLPKKWHTEFPGSDAAERCASDLEALVIAPEPQKPLSGEGQK